MCYSVMVEQDLHRLAKNFDAVMHESAFKAYSELHSLNPKKYRNLSSNPRIYPNYFAPILLSLGSVRYVQPMRYRLRPKGSACEVPSKYNVFNARLDSLEKRATWSQIFMRTHGLLIATCFFEWVMLRDKKQVVSFHARESEFLSIPVIFDTWEAPNGRETFSSFALITAEPTAEILAAGHDRCPIVLPKASHEAWLNPQNETRASIKKLLQNRELLTFEARLATP